MKTFKRFLASMLCVVIVLTAAPLSGFVGLEFPEWNLFDFSVEAEAATYSGSCGTNVKWSLDTETGVLNITGTGAMSNYTSSSSVPWYSYRSSVKTVNIAKGVTSIGSWAFDYCYSLTSVTIPDSVESIGDSAFSDCTSLTSVTIPDSVESIGDFAFSDCTSLTSVTIGDGVTSIGFGVFSACYSLTSVTIPDGVTSIGDYAFVDCTGLTSVTIGDGVTSIGDSAFFNCTGLTSVTISDSVTSIGDWAFALCESLTLVAIGDSVTSIGSDAFYECSELKYIIYSGSKEDWKKISGLYNIPLTSENIIYNVTDLNVTDVVTTEDGFTFFVNENIVSVYTYSGSATDVVIPSEYDGKPVVGIAGEAFYNSNINSITIPDSVTNIGNSAFYGCSNLKYIRYSSREEDWNKITIGTNNSCLTSAEIICGDTKITTTETGFAYVVSDGTAKILSYLGTSANLSIPAEIDGYTVTAIANNAFRNNTSITNLMIPTSITRVGTNAFSDCSKLSNVYYAGDVDSWCSIDFGSATANPLYYATNLYIGGSVLKTLTVGDEITEIKPYAFYNYGKLTEVTIGKNTEKIGSSAFEGCSTVEKLNLSESVTVIGSSAFYNCSALNTVNYGGTLADWILINFENGSSNPASISKALYIDGNKVTGIVIPEGSKEIKPYAFYNYGTLNAFELLDSMETVGNNAFYGCTVSEVKIPVHLIDALPFTGLTKITVTKGSGVMKNFTSSTYQNALWYKNNSTLKTLILENGIENIGNYAFYNSKFATTSILPESVKKIGDYAFYGCSSIKAVELSDSVEELGSYAFASCANLTSATFGENLKTIGASAFYSCSKLATMDYKGTVADWVSINFADSTANPIYYAKSLKINNQKITKLVVPSDVEKINPYAFYNCTSLKSVHLLDGVKEIGEYAFYGCTGIETVSTFSSLETVGNSAFYNCSALATITYFGDMMDWFNVNIETDNTAFSDAEVSFISGQHTHSYEQSVELEATCTSTGVMKYHCICGENYSEEISALGHTEADAIEENRVQVTCTVEGSYDTVVYCSVCNEELSRETTVIPATGHGEKILVSETLPTCEETGVRYYKCSVCGFDGLNKTVFSTSDCPQSSHSYSNNTNVTKSFSSPGAIKLVLKFSSSTKTESGYDYIYIYNKDGSLYGKYSGTQLSGKTIELQGDSFSIKLTSDSSNVYYGYSFDSITAITSNDIDYSFQEEIPATGHTPGDWEIQTYPTTKEEGVKVKKCTSCGVETDRETMEVLDEVCDYLEWTIASNRAYITGYKTGISGYITIPDEIYGYPVGSIEKGAFAGAPITGVTLGKNVNFIYDEAFAYCTELEVVRIPSSTGSISETAFVGCKNLKIILVDSYNHNYETVDGVLFNGDKTKLIYAPAKAVGKAYSIPDSVEYASDLAFIDCEDFALTIPAKFNMKYDSQFFTLLSVNEFIVDENNPYFKAIDGVLYSKDETMLVKYPIDSTRGIYYMPETVTDINEMAFVAVQEEQEVIVLYDLPYDANTFDGYKKPDYLIVYVEDILDDLTFLRIGPSHICVGGMTQEKSDQLNSDCDSFKEMIDKDWNDVKNDFTYGSAEYYLAMNSCLGQKELVSSFIICDENNKVVHNKNTVVSKVDAECFTNGYIIYKCECGYEFKEVIKATGHNYVATVIEPTCYSSGYTCYVCSDCGAMYKDNVVNPKHKYSLVAVRAPECDSDGLETYRCQYCSDEYTESIPATGHHSRFFIESVEPTCTVDGYDKIQCETCNEIVVITKGAKGHIPGENAVVKDPTCTEEGKIESTCEICGEVFTDTIPATNHEGTTEWVVVTAATCSKKGVEEKKCTLCGESLEVRDIPALSHNKASWVEVKAPTCNEKGIEALTCDYCGKKLYERETVTTDHIAGDWFVTKSPTCTEKGTEVQTCVVCYEILDTRETNVTSHLAGEWIETKAATCLEKGEEEQHCTICDELLALREIEEEEHNWDGDYVVTKEPTCTEEGREWVICEKCNTYLYGHSIPALGHTDGETVEENRIEPTCTEDGSYDLVLYCAVCGEEMSRETKKLSTTSHKFGDWKITTQPTTTIDGVKERECSVCGETETGVEPKTGITITLTDSEGKVVSETVVEGNVTNYSFSDLADGEYTVTVSKETYVSREYTVTATDGETAVEFRLNHIGDINGDGKVNTVDVARANAHAKGVSSLVGYDFTCVDVNGDGRVNTIDVARVNAHAKGVNSLW